MCSCFRVEEDVMFFPEHTSAQNIKTQWRPLFAPTICLNRRTHIAPFSLEFSYVQIGHHFGSLRASVTTHMLTSEDKLLGKRIFRARPHT
jgi:hypothetical protein